MPTVDAAEVRTRLDAIQVAGRHRVDLGDLDTLAKSMADLGLINPVTLTPDNRLVAGARRVAAARILGWEAIPARYVDNLDDAAAALRAERDENTERKAMTHSELVSLGLALEELEKPKAAARKAVGQRLGAAVTNSGQDPSASRSRDREAEEAPRGEVEEIVAGALGMSRTTYQRAKKVVAAVESGQPDADKARADMDATGNVAGNYHKVSPPDPGRSVAAVAQRRIRIAELAASGHSSGQIGELVGMAAPSVRNTAREHGIEIRADVVLGRSRKSVDSNRIVRETVNTLDGLAMGLPMVDPADLDRSEVDGWVASLTKSRTVINRLINDLKALKLKETTQ
jgi:ParB-like chromosome segregation protein Spo0J